MNIFNFKCRIIKCVYNSDEFKVYAADVDNNEYPNIKLNKYDNVSICGNIPELVNDIEYEVSAEESQNKYGISYVVKNIRRDIPTDTESTYEFLCEILTKNQADSLIKVYPDIIDRVRNNNLNDIDLSKLKGIGEYTFNKIVDKIISNFCLMDFVAEFKGYLSLSTIKKIYDKYTSIEVVKEKLKNNPYTTLCSISGIGFKKADAIILKLQKENIIDFDEDIETSYDRCLSYILYVLSENENNGNTKMNLIELRKNVIKEVYECSDNFIDAIKSDKIYYNKDSLSIGLMYTYEIEKYIADTIKDFCKNNIKEWEFDVEKYRKVNGVDLSDEQIVLLESVCKNKITILTAPAGSGKSFSTKALINMLDDNKKSYILCTPTGKSAKKLSEYTGKKANTIHRTLGYTTKGFIYNEDNNIYTNVIIVDEVGMVDVKLFYHLLKALRENTRIVLIGDIYQLNSIGCGALLRDLFNYKDMNNISFTKVFRMGEGGVLTACTYVRQNKKFISKNQFTQIGTDKSYTFIPSTKNTINDMIVALYKKLLLNNSYENITVISSYNIGDNGCELLNKLLQPIANKNAINGNECICIGKNNDIKFYVGDIVIQNCNNYEADIYNSDETCFLANGEQGVITKIIENNIVINFDNIEVVYEKNKIISNIKHAFALSTHKMQGSQNKIIIFCCPSSHMYMLTNNIVYTAISRAEERVYHFSDAKTLNIAMKKTDSIKRNTWLSDLLGNGIENE